MIQHRVKHLTTGFVLFFLATILIIVAFFGFSRAWFTNKKESKITGNVPTLGVQVASSQITPVNNNFTFTSAQIGSFQPIQPIITLTSTSSISVYVRVRITANWEKPNNEIDNDYESVFDVLDFTLGSDWIADGDLNDEAKVQDIIPLSDESAADAISGGFIYYRGDAPVNKIIKELTNNSSSASVLIQNITVKSGKTMPANLVLNIFAEVEQPNKFGLKAFGFNY